MKNEKSTYEKLAAVNVNQYVEKKGNLSYLSWTYAVDQLLRLDPLANWEYGEPVRWGETVMVFCSVTAFQKTMKAHLPVMDSRNRAIPNPDAFAVNTAMQRCLVKAIALHGLGLYIYAGEDLPREETDPASVDALVKTITSASTLEELKTAFSLATRACINDREALRAIIHAKDERKAELQQGPGQKEGKNEAERS